MVAELIDVPEMKTWAACSGRLQSPGEELRGAVNRFKTGRLLGRFGASEARKSGASVV
jgi:hypothetical protein